mmetsp:Transcript_29788/g.67484  ORF Transcript_29788/g.67484 Transcript_29788/m.67484 type:complete len:262 (+) Transcript_29788:171-956(+)
MPGARTCSASQQEPSADRAGMKQQRGEVGAVAPLVADLGGGIAASLQRNERGCLAGRVVRCTLHHHRGEAAGPEVEQRVRRLGAAAEHRGELEQKRSQHRGGHNGVLQHRREPEKDPGHHHCDDGALRRSERARGQRGRPWFDRGQHQQGHDWLLKRLGGGLPCRPMSEQQREKECRGPRLGPVGHCCSRGTRYGDRGCRRQLAHPRDVRVQQQRGSPEDGSESGHRDREAEAKPSLKARVDACQQGEVGEQLKGHAHQVQ